MTVATNDNSRIYTGDGATTTFPFPVQFQQAQDLLVIKALASGTEQVLVLGADYTVTGAGTPTGGSVTVLGAAPTGQEKIAIVRDPPLTQLSDYTEGDKFPAETHERALDKLTMIAQRLRERLARALSLPDTGAPIYNVGGNRLANVGAPAAATDAATKNYADQVAAGIASARQQTLEARDEALALQGQADEAADQAKTWRDKAQEWALSGVIVEALDYSAKWWAGRAKDWANAAVDTVVAAGEYSARHYVAKAKAEADRAQAVADSVDAEAIAVLIANKADKVSADPQTFAGPVVVPGITVEHPSGALIVGARDSDAAFHIYMSGGKLKFYYHPGTTGDGVAGDKGELGQDGIFRAGDVGRL
jgi:hypothetical protein